MSIHCFQRTTKGQSHRGALNQACRGTPPREMQCAVLYGAQLCVHKFGAFARRQLHLWVKQCFGRKSRLIRPSEETRLYSFKHRGKVNYFRRRTILVGDNFVGSLLKRSLQSLVWIKVILQCCTGHYVKRFDPILYEIEWFFHRLYITLFHKFYRLSTYRSSVSV